MCYIYIYVYCGAVCRAQEKLKKGGAVRLFEPAFNGWQLNDCFDLKISGYERSVRVYLYFIWFLLLLPAKYHSSHLICEKLFSSRNLKVISFISASSETARASYHCRIKHKWLEMKLSLNIYIPIKHFRVEIRILNFDENEDDN